MHSRLLGPNGSGRLGLSFTRTVPLQSAITPDRSRLLKPLFEPNEFSGNSEGNSACSADFTGIELIAGNSSGASTVTASFDGIKLITGGSVGTSTVSGNFGGVKTVAGGSTGASTVSGNFGGVKQCAGSSTGNSACAATFTGGSPPPPPPIGGGYGGVMDFHPRKKRAVRFLPREDKSDVSDAQKPVQPKKTPPKKPARKRREDYFDVPEIVPTPRPLPVVRNIAGIEAIPRRVPVFIDPIPGVGKDVMDALLATLEAMDVELNPPNQSLPIGSEEELLELVLLVDEIA